jgi:hypothetical protein
MAEQLAGINFINGRKGLLIPELDFTAETSPTEISRFFRAIWAANTDVEVDLGGDVLPYRGYNPLRVDDELVIREDGKKPLTVLRYTHTPPGIHYRTSRETHTMLVPPFKKGYFTPLYTVEHSSVHHESDSKARDEVALTDLLASVAVNIPFPREVRQEDESYEGRRALLTQIMRNTVAFLSADS